MIYLYFCNVLSYRKGPQLIEAWNTLIAWSDDHVAKKIKLYISTSVRPDYKFLQNGGFWWRSVIHKATKPIDPVVTWGHITNRETYMFTPSNPLATKLDQEKERTINHKGTYSFNYIVTWDHVESVIFADEKRCHVCETYFSLSHDPLITWSYLVTWEE